jgi:transcriptional regulator with XRE-family HTH domain
MDFTFGQKLKAWRTHARMTQRELAKAANVSVPYLSNLERDFSSNTRSGKPRASEAICERLAKALDIPVDEMREVAGYAPLDTGKPQTLQDVISRLEKMGVQHIEFKDEHLLRDYTPDQLQELLENISLTVELTLRRQSQK